MADTIRLITADDLARFHTAKNVLRAKCWMCGHHTWNVQSDSDHPVLVHRWVGPTGERRPDGGLLILVLSCENCGTNWSIDYQTIQDWLEENPK